jgi:hypothetical protein
MDVDEDESDMPGAAHGPKILSFGETVKLITDFGQGTIHSLFCFLLHLVVLLWPRQAFTRRDCHVSVCVLLRIAKTALPRLELGSISTHSARCAMYVRLLPLPPFPSVSPHSHTTRPAFLNTTSFIQCFMCCYGSDSPLCRSASLFDRGPARHGSCQTVRSWHGTGRGANQRLIPPGAHHHTERGMCTP